jgi:hypothetical protein
MDQPPVAPSERRHSRFTRRIALTVIALAFLYVTVAYLALPRYWTDRDAGRVLPVSSMLTETPQGIFGDPINVGLVGTRAEVLAAMTAAGWRPADPITLRSSLEIGLSVALDRPYADAPISTLIFDGRRQDLAFEKPDGISPDKRHHVRFWQIEQEAGETLLWLGSASFDSGVGISHDTGEITHHIGPDVDAERDLVMADLASVCAIASKVIVEGRGETQDARNGGGDLYRTDGFAIVATLQSAGSTKNCSPPAE